MPRRPIWNLWVNPTNVARHLSDNQEKRTQIYETINRGGFDWQVWAVAASGFFTDSYNLFATNIILPSIAYLYWADSQDDSNQRWELAINIATLGGSAVGQLLFGYLADRYGRRKLYGLELIIVIVSTLGLTQASTGYFSADKNSTAVYFPMSIQAWLIFYRLLQGIGIGGEYPMSAVITAEFASVRSRPRMMASVFLMQPLATLLAAIVGLAAVYGYRDYTPGAFGPNMNALGKDGVLPFANVKVDAIWRCVIGVGAVPAFVAILFRLTIPESPRYTLDVDMDAHRALKDALQHYGSMATVETVNTGYSMPTDGTTHQMDVAEAQGMPEHALDGTLTPHRLSSEEISPMASRASSFIDVPTAPEPTGPPEPSFFVQLYQYLRTDGNWRWLAGASLSWFILDFAYYGLGINNPRVLAKVWARQRQAVTTYNNSWDTGISNGDVSLFSNDDSNIYYVLRNDSIRSIITTSIGAIVGSILLIQVIPYVPRKSMLTWTSVLLAVLLVVTGGTLFRVFETDMHAVTITLYVLIQLVFNLGPNTLIFIFPAEIFPTRFRGTCYGIASASGKISAVIVQAILPYVTVAGKKNGEDINDVTPLATILIIWGVLMLIGALVSWWLLPEVQKPRGQGNEKGYRIPNKTLEELAEGRGGEAQQDENFASRRRVWFRSKEMNGTPDSPGQQ